MGRGFWRHKRSLDVYVYVLKIQYSTAAYKKIKLEWWAAGEYIKVKETITFKRSQLSDWVPCDSKGVISRS